MTLGSDFIYVNEPLASNSGLDGFGGWRCQSPALLYSQTLLFCCKHAILHLVISSIGTVASTVLLLGGIYALYNHLTLGEFICFPPLACTYGIIVNPSIRHTPIAFSARVRV